VAERVAAGESVTNAEVKELKNKIKERDERLGKLRAQKTAADNENRVLTRDLNERDTKLRDLTHQLDSLREELRQSPQSGKIDYEPMKSALLSLWNAAPEEIKAWFLELVMKGSENAGSGGSSPATVN
jgi:chromosome segregation ATPase